MTSSYTGGKAALEMPARGDYPATWDLPINGNSQILDTALSGTTQVTMTSSSYTLTAAETKSMRINVVGAMIANLTLNIPGRGLYVISNNTTGNFTLTVAWTGGGTSQVIPQSSATTVFIGSDGVIYADSGPWLARSGGSMTGGLSLPTNGLSIGGNQFYFNGTDIYSAYSFHATQFIQTSDVRLKTDITTIDGALEIVEALRGVVFRWKDSGDVNVGMIAQEVQNVLPMAVKRGQFKEGEYLGVCYDNLVGLLVQAVKELSAKVKQLEAKHVG